MKIRLVAFVVFCLAAGSASALSLAALFLEQHAVALLGHCMSGFIGAGAAVMADGPRQGSRTYAWVLALGIPIIGGVFVALHVFAEQCSKPSGLAVELIREAGTGIVDDLVRHHAVPTQPDSMVSLADILRSNADEDLKRSAILALERMETPKSVAILREALGDSSPEIRIYASAAISHLEERLTDRVALLEERLRLSGKVGNLHREMAEACYDFVYFGLALEVRKTRWLERSLEHAYRAIDYGGGPKSWLIAGRGLLGLERYEEAEIMFNAFLDAAPDNRDALLWRAESKFHRGDFAGVDEDLNTLAQVGHGSGPSRPTITMWLNKLGLTGTRT